MRHSLLAFGLIVLSLGTLCATPRAKAEVFTEVVAAMPYLKAPMGSYGFGTGVLVEWLQPEGLWVLPPELGVEIGLIYSERVLRAGGVKFGFYTYHYPLMLKYHFATNYVVGLGFSMDQSLENRSPIYGPKLSIGYITDTSLTEIGMSPLKMMIELQYLQDNALKGTMTAYMLVAGLRY